MATLSDGRVFTIGGSWSGGYSGTTGVPVKNGEVLPLLTSPAHHVSQRLLALQSNESCPRHLQVCH